MLSRRLFVAVDETRALPGPAEGRREIGRAPLEVGEQKGGVEQARARRQRARESILSAPPEAADLRRPGRQAGGHYLVR